MELKWLEDFVSLAETRSFSRSAELRHVTQPAFSRRIQALEAWLGTELIDRSVYPTRLTAAGQIFYEQALAMLSQFHEARTLLRGHMATPAATIEFAVPHTLSLTYFPRWLQRIEAQLGPVHTRLRALNVHDAVLSLVEGGCDLVMGYHHPSHPVALDPARYDMLTLGIEPISPFSAPGRAGRARYTLAGHAGRTCAVSVVHAERVSGPHDRGDHRERAGPAISRPALRNGHGRRSESDGAGRSWHCVPAT